MTINAGRKKKKKKKWLDEESQRCRHSATKDVQSESLGRRRSAAVFEVGQGLLPKERVLR